MGGKFGKKFRNVSEAFLVLYVQFSVAFSSDVSVVVMVLFRPIENSEISTRIINPPLKKLPYTICLLMFGSKYQMLPQMFVMFMFCGFGIPTPCIPDRPSFCPFLFCILNGNKSLQIKSFLIIRNCPFFRIHFHEYYKGCLARPMLNVFLVLLNTA